jgi:hypothetical protein
MKPCRQGAALMPLGFKADVEWILGTDVAQPRTRTDSLVAPRSNKSATGPLEERG